MNPIVNEFKSRIELLSKTDFSSKQLEKDEVFVHLVNKFNVNGRISKRTRDSILNNLAEYTNKAFDKIEEVLFQYPVLMKEFQTANNLLTFGKNVIELINRTPEKKHLQLEETLKKIQLFVINSYLNQNWSEFLVEDAFQILENNVDQEIKDLWIENAKRNFSSQINKLEEHDAFQKISEEVAKTALMRLYAPGTYIISSENPSICFNLYYYSSKDTFHTLSIDRTVNGKIFYQSKDLDKVIISASIEELIDKLKEIKVIPPELSMIPFKKSESSKAIDFKKALRWREGWKVRQVAVLPRQLLQFLEKHLVDNKNLGYLAHCLCREINEMSLNPDKYKGKSVVLKRGSKEYFFPLWVEKGVGCLALRTSLDFYLEMSSDGKKIILNIVPVNGEAGSGSQKMVYKAQQFEIPLTLANNRRACKYEDKVLHQIDGENKSRVEKIQAWHTALLDKLGKGSRLVDLPEEVLPSVNPNENDSLLYKQKWYGPNLEKALDAQIPLDFKCSSYSFLTTLNKVQVLLDITLLIKRMHEEGFVHGDIKPANILIKINPEQRSIEGHLTDLDFIGTLVRHCKIPNDNYPYWDLCSQQNLIFTPFSDLYGLGITLFDIVLGKDRRDLYYNRTILVDVDRQVTSKKDILVSSCVGSLKRMQNQGLDLTSLIEEIATSPHLPYIIISNYMDKNASILSEDLKIFFKTIFCELKVMEMVFDFMLKLLKMDTDLYNYVKSNERIQALLNSTETVNQMVGLQTLKDAFPQYSIGNFIAEIEKIILILTENENEIRKSKQNTEQ